MSAEEVVARLNEDPATRPHVQSAVATLALEKQTLMFQQVQKQLAEAREELKKRQ